MVNAGDDATVFNWALTFAFPNVDSRGNRAGIIIGQPPKVTSNDGGPTGDKSAFHLEGSYRYQVNNNINIEPGVLVIFNPENNGDHDTITVGLVRTIFSF
ncbi:MAG: iron uptake porin [Cyanobacteriota bacterium]